MHLHDIHIVVGREANGKLKQLYLGEDAVKANAEYEDASGLAVVGITSFPAFTRMRHPLEEVDRAKAALESAEAAAKAEETRLKTQAAAKRAEAKKLLAEADALAPTSSDEKTKTKTK